MKDYIEVNKKAYDDLFHEYDKRVECKSVFEERSDILGDAVLKYTCHPHEKSNVLEIGPGSGEMLCYFEDKGCRTTAVELSNNMAKIARSRSPLTVMIVSNILDIEFDVDQFDVIYAGALLHLFPLEDARKLLNKVHMWLKADGVFFVNTTINDISEEGFYKKTDYGLLVERFRRKWTEQDFMHELTVKGFRIIDRLTTDEKDRNKQWLAYICTKGDRYDK